MKGWMQARNYSELVEVAENECEWVKDEWKWVGVAEREWEWLRVGGSGWEQGLTEPTGNGCERQHMGASGVNMSRSGLNMNGSGCE